ncbi:hypothetical protein J3E68DRAFT_440882 [Trichoderma sp. SZMC 28012]
MNVINSATSFLRLLTAAPHRQLPWCLGADVYKMDLPERGVEGWPDPFLSYHERQQRYIRAICRCLARLDIHIRQNVYELDTLIKSSAANLSPIRRNPPTPVYGVLYQPKTRNLASFRHRGSYFPTQRNLLKAGRYVTEAWRPMKKPAGFMEGGVLKALTHTCLLFCLSRPLCTTGAR